MPDLQALLDQIDRLDQEATKGPWTTGENDETGLKYFGTGYCDCCIPPIPSAGVILGETGRAEAEFIALARTALPKLAAAVRAVMDLEDESLDGDLQGYEIDQYVGYNQALRSVREAITDQMEEV